MQQNERGRARLRALVPFLCVWKLREKVDCGRKKVGVPLARGRTSGGARVCTLKPVFQILSASKKENSSIESRAENGDRSKHAHKRAAQQNDDT